MKWIIKLLYLCVVWKRVRLQKLGSLPLVEYNPDSDGELTKYEFDSTVASDIQSGLHFLGVREDSIFPDLDGFTRGIRTKHAISECHYKEC